MEYVDKSTYASKLKIAVQNNIFKIVEQNLLENIRKKA